MSTLSNYKEKVAAILGSNESLTQDTLMELQELHYRIFVLEAFSAIAKKAPIPEDSAEAVAYFQVVSLFLDSLTFDHRIGQLKSQEEITAFKTALSSLKEVISDQKRRFPAYNKAHASEYPKHIFGMLATISNVWLQYRHTLVKFI